MFKWIQNHIEAVGLLVVALLVWLATTTYWEQKLQEAKEECRRLKVNNEILLSTCDTLTMANGQHVAKMQQLQVAADELEWLLEREQAKLQALGIKHKRVQSLTNTASTTSFAFTTIADDSLQPLPAAEPALQVYDTIKRWHWADEWVSASGELHSDGRVVCDVSSKDSLLIVAHRVPKRFLFFRYGTKSIEVDVVSSNPHTKLNYVRSIKVLK